MEEAEDGDVTAQYELAVCEPLPLLGRDNDYNSCASLLAKDANRMKIDLRSGRSLNFSLISL